MAVISASTVAQVVTDITDTNTETERSRVTGSLRKMSHPFAGWGA
jgi:hypothetical protein